MLKIEGLYKCFGDKEVLCGLDMAVPEHSVFGFIGKNGSGKTTTMKAVLGLLTTDFGEIVIPAAGEYLLIFETCPESLVEVTDEEGNLLGFCVTEIMEDGAEPFGMICDLLVRENCRCGGVGTALMENALAWLRSKGVKDVYLESGMHNHAAHEYFIRRGFRKVSEIYKLM